jgi:RHS repeat-associated protein
MRLARWLFGVAATVLALAVLPASTIADPSCTDTWTGGAGTEVWQTAANWSTGSAPGSGDIACVGSGVTVQVTSGTNQAASLQDEGGLDISGGSLELESPSEASSTASLTLSGGTLTGAGEVDVSGSFSWTGGAMTGTGKTVLEAGAAGSIDPGSGSAVSLSGRDLVNRGTLTWSSGSVEGRSSAEIDNSGTFDANADASGGEWSERGLLNSDGSDVWLHNTGTVKKASGSVFTQIQFQMDNEGTVEVKTGQIILTGGNHGGTAEGGSWAGVEGGGMVFNSGSYILGSGVGMSGSVFLTGGSVQAADVQAPEATLWLWSGSATLTLTSTSTASHLGTFNLNSATTLTGAGTLDIASSFAWAGAMSGSGQTVLGSGATGSIDPGSGSSVELTERELVNEGTLTWSTGLVEGRDSAEIDNSGTFDANADASGGEWWERGLLNSDGSNVWLRNTGTVKKASGSLFTQIQFQMDNEGTVEVKTGQIILTGGNHGGTAEEGSWAGAEGGGMVFNSGSYTLGSDVGMSGSVFLTGGSVQAADVQAPEATLWLWGGSATLTLTSTSTASHLGTFNVNSATTLTGAGTLDIASSFAWAGGGAMSGSGSTVLESGAAGTVEAASGCESMSLAERTLVNAGTLTFGSGTLLLSEGASFDNQGTFKDNSESSCYGPQIKPAGSGGAPSLLNTGTFEKTAGAGTSTVAVSFGNDGHVEAQIGELDFADGGIPEEVATGSWSVHSGASIVLSSGTFPIAEEVDLSAVDVSGATVERESLAGPSNTSPPTISGTAWTGKKLTAGAGLWAGTKPLAYTYQWQTCNSSGASCSNISGATSSSYTVAHGDIGGTLRVIVTATNLLGSASSTSEATAVAIESTCTDSWTGASEGTWQTAANWSAGSVPGPSDVACIESGITAQVTGGANQAGSLWDEGALVISGGSLELSGGSKASSVSSLTVTGGTLGLAGQLDVLGSFAGAGGGHPTISGSGSLVIASEASGTVDSAGCGSGGGDFFLDGIDFVNEGTLTFGVAGGGANGDLVMSGGAQVQNAGTLNVDSWSNDVGPCNYTNYSFYNDGGVAPSITNTGTLNVDVGSGHTALGNVSFSNQGTVKVASGTLQLSGGGSDTEGEWSTALGTALSFAGGSFSLSGDTWAGSGAIGVAGASVSATDLKASDANLTVGSGSLAISEGSTVSFAGLDVNGGSLTLPPGSPISTGALTVTGGTLSVAGELDVLGSFAGAGGGHPTISGSGSLVIASEASGTVDSAGCGSGGGDFFLDGIDFVNEGTLTFGVAGGGANGDLVMSGGAQVQNAGTLNVDSWSNDVGPCNYTNYSFYNDGGVAPSITNTGTLNVDVGSGHTALGNVSFGNQGTVKVASGSLQFGGGGISEQVSTGNWYGLGTNSIRLTSGTFMVEGGVNFDVDTEGATIVWVAAHLTGALEAASPATGTVTVSGHGEGGVLGTFASVEVEVAPAGTSEWHALCGPALAGSFGEFSCSWNTASGSYPDGEYQLRGSLSTSSSPPATALTPTITVLVDNTAPSGSLTAPAHSIGGSPTITGTASDSGSGVQSWQLQIAPEGSSEWTNACPEQTSPISSTTYGCAVNTTTRTDGAYELRALIMDMAGNTYTTSTVGLPIDNTTPSGSLASVSTYLRNTVELSGTASGSVASWAVQTAPAGTSSWSDACSASSATSGSEYRCSLDTTTLADGEYQFRAVITDGEGDTYTTASRSTTIDNTAPGGALYPLPAKVSGNVEVDGYAYDTGSGVASWKLQIAPAGSETYEEACPSESLLVSGIVYGCTLETGHLTSGTYHLRAVIVDNAGNAYTTSVVSATVESAAPTSSVAPAISGEAVDGRTLSASTGDWSGDGPISYVYQWRRCNSSGESCSNIAGATDPTYVLAAADVSSTLRVVVTASNAAGEASATSSASEVVAAGTLANVSVPVISGSMRVGSALDADPSRWRGTPPISYAYQWQRCNGSGEECANIEGATKQSYTPVTGDLSKTMRVKVTATNSEGSASTTSAASPQVVEGAGSGIRYLYDEADRLDLVDDPTQGAAVYHWDADGNLTSIQRYSASTLAVLQVTPAHAPPGTQVDITGTGFSAEASNDEVSFDGTAATVSKATTTDLIVTVPEGASTGAITVKIGEHSAESPGAFKPFVSTVHGAAGDSRQSSIAAQPALAAPSIASTVPASPAAGRPASKPTSNGARRCRSHTRLKTCRRPSGRRASQKRATARRCGRRRQGMGHGAPHARCIASVHHKAKHATIKHAAKSKMHKPRAGNASSRTTAAPAASTQTATGPQSQAVPASVSAYRSPYTASWRPEAKNRRDGNWTTARQASPWAKLPQFRAPRGATALSGQALEVDGLPLANVTLTIQGTGKHAKTDSSGRFLLSGLSAGHQVLIIEGQTADGHSQRYGRFTVGVDLTKGETNPLGYTIWMTPLEAAGDSTIPTQPKHETVLTNPSIPGLEVRLPAGTTVRSANGAVVHHLNLTAIPIDRTPFPLPFVTGIPTYFTVQPGGAYLNKGAQIVYPNWGHLPPGQRVEFWNYDPTDRGWYIYGEGSVSKDGKQVIPDPNVRVWEFTGAMIAGGSKPSGGPSSGAGAGAGDPVDVGSGLFAYEHQDLQLPDAVMPFALTRTYRPNDPSSYSFGIGTESPFDLHLWSDENYKTAYLVLSDGGAVKFKRISSGTGFIEAVYSAVETPGPWEGAVLEWYPSEGGWVIHRRDGIKFYFPDYDPVRMIEDANGNRIKIVREGGGAGPVVEIRTPHDRTIYLRHDSYNRITEATDSAGQKVRYQYDSDGRLVKVTDPIGVVTRYAYNTANDMTSVTDGRGNVLIANTYDAEGHVISQTLGGEGTYKFNPLPVCSGCEARGISASEITDPDGHKRDVYFEHWMPVGEILNPGPSEVWKTFTRNAAGNVTKVTSSTGTVSMSYDEVGNITAIERESSSLAPLVTRITYNSMSEPTSITNPLGQTTIYGYDTNGNLTAVTDPTGQQTTYTYDGSGELTSVTDPEGNTTQYGYGDGQRTTVTNQLGDRTELTYDTAGLPIGVRDPEGKLTALTYDADGRLMSETGPAGEKTNYGYDADGNLVSITDPRGHTQTATYDGLDQLASWTDALGRATTYEHDATGNLTSTTNPDGETTSYGYDGLNRLSSISFGAKSGGSPTSIIGYTYNQQGEPSKVTDSRAGTRTMNYDSYGRLTEESGPNGSVGYSYDAADQRTGMTIDGEPAASYTYNADGELAGIESPQGDVSFAYDPDGRRVRTTLPNGDSENYSYDGASLPTGVDYTRSGGEQIGDLQYGRDALGRVTTVSGSEARTNLPEAFGEASYNAANELTSLEGHELTYDADGDLLGDGTSSYTWNDRGELAGVTRGSNTWSFAYDPFGRRIGKTTGGAETSYLYAGEDLAAESSGASHSQLLSGLGLDEDFSRTTGAGTESYLTEALGSALALTGESGTPTTEYTYQPFGAATTSGTTSSNPDQFTGRENDGDGLQYNRARYYDPSMGRFISRDPSGLTGSGINLYRYAGDDPTDLTDPRGLCNADPVSVGFWTEGNCLSEHPTEVVTGIAIGTCIFGDVPGCIRATIAVFGTATWQNAEHSQCGSFLSHEGVTLALTAAGAGPGLIFGGLKVADLIGDEVLPTSQAGKWALNTYLTGPSAGAAAAEAGAGAASTGPGSGAGAGGGEAGAGGAGAAVSGKGGCE